MSDNVFQQPIDQIIEASSDTEEFSIIPFRIHRNCFSLPTSNIVTLSGKVDVHAIPFNANKFVEGLVAINSEVYILLNVINFLSIDNHQQVNNENIVTGLYQRIAVVKLENRIIAISVDEVYPICRVQQSDIIRLTNDDLFKNVSNGYYPKNDDWIDNNYLLDLDKFSNLFEISLE